MYCLFMRNENFPFDAQLYMERKINKKSLDEARSQDTLSSGGKSERVAEAITPPRGVHRLLTTFLLGGAE